MRRGVFRRLPIKHKLVAMIMSTSVIVLLLASTGYLLADYFRTRREIANDLRAQAQLVLQNSQAALDFNDRDAAAETLRTLASGTHLRAACLYDANDDLFMGYSRLKTEPRPCPARAPADGYTFAPDRLELSISDEANGKRFGSIMLGSDLRALTARLRLQGIVVAVLLALTLGVALVLSSRLQNLVSRPVMVLAETAADVSSRGDYSVRATRTTDDELGTLVDAFNRMLERIELREAELSKTNDDLRREITDRRKAEQERAELLVREREANRLKDEFLMTLSHELRTPLNAILGWTKLLRANAIPAVSVDRALEKVERNAQVQSRLIEDLLDISRIASGKLRLEYRTFDLVQLASSAIDSIRPTAEARGVVIERRFEAAALPTSGDADRLQQVIWNLLSNAVKFTPAAGVVTVGLRRVDRTDEITISDTGIGIDPGFLPHVFDTFRQADASSTRAHGGLGLGLSLVKRFVDMHGGEVHATSAGTNQGATFTVKLPVRVPERLRARETTAAPLGPLPLPEGRLAGTAILVVDDDADTRELLSSVLSTAGGRVQAVPSAEDALQACVELPPDIIVSDIAMPGRDGYTLMRQLSAVLGPRTPRVRIALSAFVGERDRERSAAAGFQRHVPKPVDPVALVLLLEEILAKGESLELRGSESK